MAEEDKLRDRVCNGRVPKDPGEYNRWYNEYMSNKAFDEQKQERRKTCLHSSTSYNSAGILQCNYCGKKES